VNWAKKFVKDGIHQSGSCLWYGDTCPDSGQIEEQSKNCSNTLRDLSGRSLQLEHDKLFAYCLQNINNLSGKLGILWELLKDQLLKSSTIYIGFLWDIELRIVSLSPEKVETYLLAIHKWRKQQTHILHDVQKLYSKLLHACSAVPRGCTYLTGLESTLAPCGNNLFLPHRPEKSIAEDLIWWSDLLQSGRASRNIYPQTSLKDPSAFSDTSSSIRTRIIIGEHWRV
jgi:hypothetical protein